MISLGKSKFYLVEIFIFGVLALLMTGCGGSARTTPNPANPTPPVQQNETGTLNVVISGLPSGSSPDVVLTGPSEFSQSLTNSQNFEDLEPGSYTLTSKAVLASDNFGYSPDQSEQSVEVNTTTSSELTVNYNVSSGSLFVAITGMSVAAEADVLVTGPNSFNQTVTESTVLTDLEPGAYEVRGQDTTTNDAFFKATGLTNQSILINQGTTTQVDIAYTCQRVILLDSKLVRLVRGTLSKPSGDITCEDMALVEQLASNNLSNLSGLQHAINLKSLSFDGQIVGVSDDGKIFELEGVSDLSPISELKSLISLEIGNSPITDLSALSGLSNLKNLDLDRISFSDFSPFAALDKLEKLEIRSNPQMANGDLSVLKTLKSLNRLNIRSSDFSNLSFVQGMTSLETLYFDGTMITDLSPVASLINLKRLIISESLVSDLSPLQNLSQLVSFSISSSPISDLSSLANKSQLQTISLGNLDLNNNSLNALAGLPRLEEVNLSRMSNLTSISTLSNLTQLKTLRISNTLVTDFTPLASLSNLVTLHITSSNLTSIAFLSSFSSISSIEKLDLHNNFISDITPLVNNTNFGSQSSSFMVLGENCLDLSDGSDDSANVQILENRGVSFASFAGQKEASECTF